MRSRVPDHQVVEIYRIKSIARILKLNKTKYPGRRKKETSRSVASKRPGEGVVSGESYGQGLGEDEARRILLSDEAPGDVT